MDLRFAYEFVFRSLNADLQKNIHRILGIARIHYEYLLTFVSNYSCENFLYNRVVIKIILLCIKISYSYLLRIFLGILFCQEKYYATKIEIPLSR